MEVFFYGLFMDREILSKNGVKSSNPRMGFLLDYALKIGHRASLLPSPGERAYGILMTVESEAIQALYAEASVADYIPEEVNIVTTDNEQVAAICYNLPVELLTGTNETYARALHKLAKQLGLPHEYLRLLEKIGLRHS